MCTSLLCTLKPLLTTPAFTFFVIHLLPDNILPNNPTATASLPSAHLRRATLRERRRLSDPAVPQYTGQQPYQQHQKHVRFNDTTALRRLKSNHRHTDTRTLFSADDSDSDTVALGGGISPGAAAVTRPKEPPPPPPPRSASSTSSSSSSSPHTEDYEEIAYEAMTTMMTSTLSPGIQWPTVRTPIERNHRVQVSTILSQCAI